MSQSESAGRDPYLEEDATEALVEILGWRFEDCGLLVTALTHPSRSHEEGGGRGNERLEFLGDAVLDLVMAELLYRAEPSWTEGDLTRARATLVNSGALAARAREIGLGGFARLGRTEIQSGGAEKDSILANLFEAVVGALYLDAGLDAVRAFVQRIFAARLAEGAKALERDPKTRFQEWSHLHLRATPTYRFLRDSGIDADPKRFEVEVRVAAEGWGRGTAGTKRGAERVAARAALDRAEVRGG